MTNFQNQGIGSQTIGGVFNQEISQSLGVKDLSIIEDQLYNEALAFKKWSVYANQLQDQQLKTMAQTAAQHHRQHFDALQNYLNGKNA